MKLAALILTCSLPQYVKRKDDQIETVKFLRNSGIDVYYLYGNHTATDSLVIDDKVVVHVEEEYEYIPLRIFKGFEALRSKGYLGILKMDDDIQITNKDQFINALSSIVHLPYASIKSVGGREFRDKTDLVVVNTYHWNKCKNPLLNSQYSLYPAVDFAGGPMYWVGTILLEKLAESDYKKCIFEDVCLGIAAKKHGFSLAHSYVLFERAIRGDDSPWPYRQYTFKNADLHRFLVES